MSLKLSFNVLLVSLITMGLPSQAQSGPPPGVRASPSPQAAPNRPMPRTNPNPAANVPAPIARLPRGAQALDH